MARWTTRGSWIPTIPDPAPCFVKSGAGYAQQSYEKHSVVEPVRGGPHAGEAPELDMETLRNTRLDRSTGDQRRSEIRSLASRPGPGNRQLVGLDAVTLQILERTIAVHRDFVRNTQEHRTGGQQNPRAVVFMVESKMWHVSQLSDASRTKVFVEAHWAIETRCNALKLVVGSRNTQVVSTNGAVSAGMPSGVSATAMAANTIALNITPIDAYIIDQTLSTRNRPPRAIPVRTALKP